MAEREESISILTQKNFASAHNNLPKDGLHKASFKNAMMWMLFGGNMNSKR